MRKRVRRAERKCQIDKCLYRTYFELHDEILTDMLAIDLDTCKQEVLDGAYSKNTAGRNTAEIAEDVASRSSNKSLLTVASKKSFDNNECIHLNSVLDDARTTMDESCLDSSIEDIVLVLDSSDESMMDDTSMNDEHSNNGCSQADATCIPFLSDSLENTIINIFGDQTENEETGDDNYGKLDIDFDLTPEAIETSAMQSVMLDECVDATADLPASSNTFWNFVQRLTNPQQDEKEKGLDSADCKSTTKVLSHEKAESRVSNLPCTKNTKEEYAKGASTSNEIVGQKKKCPSPSNNAGSNEKKPKYGRFDEELAKLDEQLLCTTKSHKVVSTEKLSATKNSPPRLNASASVHTKKSVVTTKAITRTTSDTRCDNSIKKKHTIHETGKNDKARKKNSSGSTDAKKHEFSGKNDVAKKKNVNDAAVTSKKPMKPLCEEIDKSRTKNSEGGTAVNPKQEHLELKQNDAVRRKSSETAVVISKKHESHEHEKTDNTRHKNCRSTTPELIADKVGAEICEPRVHTNPNQIKINVIVSQYRNGESTRTENCTSIAQEDSHSGNTTINITGTVLEEDSTMKVIRSSNNNQISETQISLDITTGVDIADCSETGKPSVLNKTNTQRKRVQQIIETDCPLKKHKSYSLVADDANNISRRKRKRLRKKFRKLFGATATTSEEDEEDMLIQRKRRKRKHSIKSNDSGISIRGSNIMSLMSNEVVGEIEKLPTHPSRKHGKHGLKKSLERPGEKQSIIDKSIKSKETEYVQANVEKLTALPEIDKKSTSLETNEVVGSQGNTPIIVKPNNNAKATNNNSYRSDNTAEQPESPTKDSQLDAANKCDSLKCLKSIRSTLRHSESSDVVSSAKIDQTDLISEDDATCNNVESNDDEHVVSSSQDSTKSVNTNLHSSTAQLQEDIPELLETQVVGRYQVITKGNTIRIEEIKDVNENIIKQKDTISSMPIEAEECASPAKSTDHENKFGETAKDSQQSIEKKDEYCDLKNMPLLDELLAIDLRKNNKKSITPTSKEDINIVSIMESSESSIQNSEQNLQLNDGSKKDIVEAPAPIYGQLRVRTSEELGSRWCPTPSLIPTSDTSAVTSVVTSASNSVSSNTNANIPEPNSTIPVVPLLFQCITAVTPTIQKVTNNYGGVTVALAEPMNKASNKKELQSNGQRHHPRTLSQKPVPTGICDPPRPGVTITPVYRHRTPETTSRSNKRSYSSNDSAPGQIANATGASGGPSCNTFIAGPHPSSVQTGINMIPAQSRSGTAVTSAKQSPIYSTVILSNSMSPMNVAQEQQQPIRTSASVSQGDLYKYALSNQQAQHIVQVNAASMNGDFRVPVSMAHQTNLHTVYAQNKRVSQTALQRLASMSERQQYLYQGLSSNGPQMRSGLHTPLVTSNANSNVSLPSHIIATTTCIPVSSNGNASIVGQVQITPAHQYNQHIPVMNQQVPIVNMPSIHKQVPVMKQQAQVAFHQIPLNHQYPNLTRQILVNSNQIPVIKQQIPVINQQLPHFNPMLSQTCCHPVNQIIQKANVAQSYSPNLVQQAVPVIALAQEQRVPHTMFRGKQTPSPTAQKTVNVGGYGQQGLSLQDSESQSKDLRISEKSPRPSSTKCCQERQSPTTAEVEPLPQEAEISNPSNVAPQPVPTEKTKFEFLKKLRLEQQVQLVRQIDCYLISCFSLSQYMTKKQWNEVQSTKSVLMELKTVLDDHIKVLLQDYCYEPSSDTDASESAEKPDKPKIDDCMPSVETSNTKNKENSDEEKLEGKTGDSTAADEANNTEGKSNLAEEQLEKKKEQLEENKEERESAASTEGREISKEIKDQSDLSGVTRMNEEELEILRAMYREWCEPEDSATSDSNSSPVKTSDSQVSADSQEVKTEVVDSAIDKPTVNSSEIEIMAVAVCSMADAASTNNDTDMKDNYRANQSITDNDENTISSVETVSFATFADHQQAETNTKETTPKIRTHSSESSLVANTPEDLSDIDEKTTISNADIETCAKDSEESDCVCIDDIKSEEPDIYEDSESTSEHLECISNYDETTCTSIISLSDNESCSFETSAELKAEDIDNLSENLVNAVAPPSPEIAIAGVSSISIDTFDILDRSVEHETILIDGDDIEEMCESKSCLQCDEPSAIVCGGCLEAQYCLLHYSGSAWTDHCKECRSLDADVL